jgi:hypothetical protein
MIVALAMTHLAPLEYRYALDAALTCLPRTTEPLTICNVAALTDELRQRLPQTAETTPAAAALWIEPLTATWRMELASLTARLTPDAPLAVIASRPLARLIPERRAWPERSLGMRPGGVAELRRALVRAGYRIDAEYGIHSVMSIVLNGVSQRLERWDRPDLGDRLHFAARLRYCTTGAPAALTTVALLAARKERG